MGYLEIRLLEGVSLIAKEPEGEMNWIIILNRFSLGFSNPQCVFLIAPNGVPPKDLAFNVPSVKSTRIEKSLFPNWKGQRIFLECSDPSKDFLSLTVNHDNRIEQSEIGQGILLLILQILTYLSHYPTIIFGSRSPFIFHY